MKSVGKRKPEAEQRTARKSRKDRAAIKKASNMKVLPSINDLTKIKEITPIFDK